MILVVVIADSDSVGVVEGSVVVVMSMFLVVGVEVVASVVLMG